MSRAALVTLSLVLIFCGDGSHSCQRGFPRIKAEVLIPAKIYKGQFILTVPFSDCGLSENIWFSANDSDFEVFHNRSVHASKPLTIDGNREFEVWAVELVMGETWMMHVLLILPNTELAKRRVQVIQFPTKRTSRRQKREWIIPPMDITENQLPSTEPIAAIRSEFEDVKDIEITYTITGFGANKPPLGLFVINPRTGDITITRSVDREVYSSFNLVGSAFDQFGEQREKPVNLHIKVVDVNDNPPVFTQEIFSGSVEELSASGTIAAKVIATDKDEGKNGRIHYKIKTESVKATFYGTINGEIKVTDSSLDREMQDFYTFIVEAKDMDGSEKGLKASATVQIKILDVNDNIPTVEQTTYEITVNENTKYFDAIHLKVHDKDLEFSDNWLGHFEIIKGNEQDYFRIEVNNQTNEGILIIQKALNYEEMRQVHLVILLKNKAAFHHTISQSIQLQPIAIKVHVKDLPECIEFKPSKLVRTITESFASEKTTQVIGIYQAVRVDSGESSKKTKYAKNIDVANWLSINSDTGEITLNGVIDRESLHVINGTYTATVLAISSEQGSSFTCTGTIVINVQDVNDHLPIFDDVKPCMCSHADSLRLTASDSDGPPFGAPLRFNIEPNKVWKLGGRTDATSMELIPLDDLWPGVFPASVWIEDNKGKGHTVNLDVHVSDCHDVNHCFSERLIQPEAVLGGPAVILMILPVLLLLFLPLLLLLFCQCGHGIPEKTTFILAEKPESHGTLGQGVGEGGQFDTMIPFLKHPGNLNFPPEWSTSNVEADGGYVGEGSRWNVKGALGLDTGRTTSKCRLGMESEYMDSRQLQTGFGDSEVDDFNVFSEVCRININDYINQKLLATAEEWKPLTSCDCMLVYDDEGSNLPVASLDCCDLVQEVPLDYSFLNDLDPRFKALAEICNSHFQDRSSENVTFTSWELNSKSQPVIKQKEFVQEDTVSTSVMNRQHSMANPLSLKKHYIVTTTIQRNQEELPVGDGQIDLTQNVSLQHKDVQSLPFTTDPATAWQMTGTELERGTGELEGVVPNLGTAPVLQENVEVTGSATRAWGAATDPSTGQRSLGQKVVVMQSLSLGSEEGQGMMSKQLFSQVPASQEKLEVPQSVNAGLRESSDINVTASRSTSKAYKSVKNTTKRLQLVQE
ncbi:desmoglein-4-like [Narcine bancroftii]|uniref:desmoglein-4-like n=1 Tax=Narcine bancroftii TaxID=1343680 RepID=UPI0038311493